MCVCRKWLNDLKRTCLLFDGRRKRTVCRGITRHDGCRAALTEYTVSTDTHTQKHTCRQWWRASQCVWGTVWVFPAGDLPVLSMFLFTNPSAFCLSSFSLHHPLPLLFRPRLYSTICFVCQGLLAVTETSGWLMSYQESTLRVRLQKLVTRQEWSDSQCQEICGLINQSNGTTDVRNACACFVQNDAKSNPFNGSLVEISRKQTH